MHDLIFVYGSLLGAIANPQSARLRAEASLLGAGRLIGRLYRISWYPGAVRAEAAADQVHGEVYRLRDPAASLLWLDDYEAITPPPGERTGDAYERCICPIALDGGATVEAWVYLYRHATVGLERVASGRWTG